MNKQKTAIIIADSYGEPFESIKKFAQPFVWGFPDCPDLFYVRGNIPNRIDEILNKNTDRLRYSKLWPLQRIFDQLQISLHQRHEIKSEINGRNLHIGVPEGLRYLGLKIASSLQYLYDEGYQVIYKTTLSSLVNPERFLNEINSIQEEVPYYGGTPINFGSHPFISGANLMLNRKSVEIVLSNLNNWNHGLLDDVAIGRLLEGKVQVTPLTSLNFSSMEMVEKESIIKLKNTMHFRCKSALNNRDDIAIMTILKKRLTDEF